MPSGFASRRLDKLVPDLKSALRAAGLRDGMTLSFHHHLRDGDYVVNQTLEAAEELGVRNLTLAPSALFPVHAPVVDHIRSGLVRRIEGSCNGPIGDAASHGLVSDPVVLRSHGGRVRAIHAGEIRIDIAVIAASAADDYGNATGLIGRSACGPLCYPKPDAMFGEKVIVVTDNLVDYPCIPYEIPQTQVDYVAVVDTIGDPAKIVSGTTKISEDADRQGIAQSAAELIRAAGLIKDGMGFQAGAGGLSLAVTKYVSDMLEDAKAQAAFVCGGTTQISVDMLHKGLTRALVTGQVFDTASIRSLLEDRNHAVIDLGYYANISAKGNIVCREDAAVLGATEVDVNFNVNVNTHSDGRLLHGIGGHQDVAAGAGLTIITCPSFRKTVPIVRDAVTTVTTPGAVVDAIVTEQGVSINPRRKDLLRRVKGSDLPLIDIEEVRDNVYASVGAPEPPRTLDRIIGVLQWRDGSVIDVIRQVA